jgi:hypothetical protein
MANTNNPINPLFLNLSELENQFGQVLRLAEGEVQRIAAAIQACETFESSVRITGPTVR